MSAAVETIPQQSVRIWVPGIAKPAGSKRAFAFVGKDGKPHSRVVDACAKGKSWQACVREAAAVQMHDRELMSGGLSVDMVFVMQRPMKHYNARGELKDGFAAEAPTKRPDVLKLARGVEDALTGIVWRDDSLIVEEYLIKQYVKQYADKPGVQIDVRPLE